MGKMIHKVSGRVWSRFSSDIKQSISIPSTYDQAEQSQHEEQFVTIVKGL